MKKNILIAVAASLFSISVSATTIANEAGQLSINIPNPTSITDLKIIGTIDAADMHFISMKMTKLSALDLSGASIAAYKGAIIGTSSSYDADYIPTNAFAGSSFSFFTFPTTPNLQVGPGAFAGTNIVMLTVPNNVTEIGAGCFTGSSVLKNVYVNGKPSLGDGAFSNCPVLETVTFDNPVSIPVRAFYACPALTTINAPAVTSIGDRAFSGDKALTSFTFSPELTSIGEEAFMFTSLKEVNLSACKKLEHIGHWAFASMPELSKFIAASTDVIGDGVVFNCPKLTSVTLSTGIKEIPDFAFANTSVAEPENFLHDSVERIGKYAMSGLDGIEELELPESLQMIDDHGMENMSGLKKITTTASAVPDLGEDVWAGIDQSQVDLVVNYVMIPEFENADQWCNFNIMGATSGSVDNIFTEITQLRGRFEGDDLIVKSDGLEIARLTVYNTSGQLLAVVAPDSDTVTIDTAGFGTRIFVIHAVLADGRTAVLKLSK